MRWWILLFVTVMMGCGNQSLQQPSTDASEKEKVADGSEQEKISADVPDKEHAAEILRQILGTGADILQR